MSKTYPVITLKQPWATWVMRGWKLIETRTHSRFAKLEGKTILIHSSLSFDDGPEAKNNPYLTDNQLNYKSEEMVRGCLLGTVHVWDFGKLTAEDSKASLIDCGSVDRWGLFLDSPHELNAPIPEVGELNVWYYDLVERKKVKKQKIEELKLF